MALNRHHFTSLNYILPVIWLHRCIPLLSLLFLISEVVYPITSKSHPIHLQSAKSSCPLALLVKDILVSLLLWCKFIVCQWPLLGCLNRREKKLFKLLGILILLLDYICSLMLYRPGLFI